MKLRTIRKELARTLSFMKPRYFSYLVGLIGTSVLASSIMILVSFIMRFLIDATVEKDPALLSKAILLMAVATPVFLIAQPVFEFMFQVSIRKTMAEIRIKVYRHVLSSNIQYMDNTHSGEIISSLSNDVQAMEQAYGEQLRMLIVNILGGLGSAVFMFFLDYRIACILIVFGIISAFLNARFAVPIREISKNVLEKTSQLTGKLTDLLAGFQVIKMFNIREILIQRFSVANNEVRNTFMKRIRISAFMDGMNFLLVWVNFGGVIAIGSIMAMKGEISLGKLMAMIQLLNAVTYTFTQIGVFISNLQASLAGSERIFKILDMQPEPLQYEISGVSDSQYAVHLEDISFSYEEDKKVLEGVSIKAGMGQVIALVGSSGGGKSTVMKLILGYYAPQSGGMSLMGKAYSEQTLAQVRAQIAYIPQDAYLFEGNILDNIRMGNPLASEEEIYEAAKAANAHDFILTFPNGYETAIGEMGSKLSGGQKQRIAIARAFLKNAPILLMDEATSALDSESEQLVQDALGLLMQGRTVIVIAHRLSTIQHADVIFVLDQGRVAECGNHEELISRGGIYQKLNEIQFKAM